MVSTRQRGLRFIALAAVTPVAFALSACTIGLTNPASDNSGNNSSTSQQEKEDTSSSAADKKEDSASTETKKEEKSDAAPAESSKIDPSKVLGTWQGKTEEGEMKVDINSVIVTDNVTTLTLTITNMGPTKADYTWPNAFGGSFDLLRKSTKILDTKSNLVYSPGLGEGSQCICSESFMDLEPGDSQTVYTTYKALPEDVKTVTIMMEGTLPFENIPVTRK